jgi:hemerythrin-like domain-containing protein
MAEMSMNKAIHGAVRRDLARFLTALDSFTEGDSKRAQQLGSAWANFDDQLTHHHEGEHEIAWPALVEVGVDPAVLEQMDAEHDVMATALGDARAAVTALAATGTGAAAARSSMTKLQEVTVAHLEHEEAEIEPVFLAQQDHPAIKRMGREFGKVSPMRGGRFFAWVLDGATAEERAGATGSIPGPVLTIIGGVFGLPYRRSIAPVWKG